MGRGMQSVFSHLTARRAAISILITAICCGLAVGVGKPAQADEGVCNRSQAIQDAILRVLIFIDDCAEVTNEDLARIVELDASDAELTSLADGDLTGMTKLARLDLGDNSLSQISVAAFSGLDSLNVLWLNYNEFASINGDIFSGTPNLTSLILSDNSLRELPSTLFEHVPHMKHFAVWDNNLTTVPDRLFDDLDMSLIYLNENEISSLPTGLFANQPSLTLLDLSDNNLSSLDDGLLEGLSGLGSLEISNNDLDELPEGLFLGLSKLALVDFEGNPGAPFTLQVELEQRGGQIVLTVAEGAPAPITGRLSITGGSLDGTTVEIEPGADQSDPVGFTKSGGGDVIVSISSAGWDLSGGPYSIKGLEVSAGSSLTLQAPNGAATGAPTISGTAQVGETLEASISGIEDDEGLDKVEFTYQWIRSDSENDADIAGATDSSYIIQSDDLDRTLSVRVEFQDDAGYDESLTSVPTETVAASGLSWESN